MGTVPRILEENYGEKRLLMTFRLIWVTLQYKESANNIL